MSSRRNSRVINLPAPYLRRVWLDASRVTEPESYPFCLPLFRKGDFDLAFDRAVTIVVGENGTGKSTLLEGIAALAGYDEAGGGKGYTAVDHSGAIELMGGRLSDALRASWLPKITNGWFFRAESFFSVARYLDEAARAVRGRLISSPTRMAKAFCASSTSAAGARASSSSTSPSRRSLRRVRSTFSSCCAAWTSPASARSSWRPMRRS
jgi:predicted ATPase